MIHATSASVDWFGGWSMTGELHHGRPLAAAASARYGAILARRPSHDRNSTPVSDRSKTRRQLT